MFEKKFLKIPDLKENTTYYFKLKNNLINLFILRKLIIT